MERASIAHTIYLASTASTTATMDLMVSTILELIQGIFKLIIDACLK